jgi:hypothetical protein
MAKRITDKDLERVLTLPRINDGGFSGHGESIDFTLTELYTVCPTATRKISSHCEIGSSVLDVSLYLCGVSYHCSKSSRGINAHELAYPHLKDGGLRLPACSLSRN